MRDQVRSGNLQGSKRISLEVRNGETSNVGVDYADAVGGRGWLPFLYSTDYPDMVGGGGGMSSIQSIKPQSIPPFLPKILQVSVLVLGKTG